MSPRAPNSYLPTDGFIGGIMGLTRRACGVAVLAIVVMAIACTSDARSIECDNGDKGGIGPITNHVNADVIVPSGAQCDFGVAALVNGDIEVEGSVNGNIKVDGGEVYVRGAVNGNIEASSGSHITVDGGTVEGNIKMEGDGDVTVKPGSTVAGNIEKEGTGDVTIESGSIVEGNVKCGGSGSNRIDGTVEGNIVEC